VGIEECVSLLPVITKNEVEAPEAEAEAVVVVMRTVTIMAEKKLEIHMPVVADRQLAAGTAHGKSGLSLAAGALAPLVVAVVKLAAVMVVAEHQHQQQIQGAEHRLQPQEEQGELQRKLLRKRRTVNPPNLRLLHVAAEGRPVHRPVAPRLRLRLRLPLSVSAGKMLTTRLHQRSAVNVNLVANARQHPPRKLDAADLNELLLPLLQSRHHVAQCHCL